jgi:hypothetical protein
LAGAAAEEDKEADEDEEKKEEDIRRAQNAFHWNASLTLDGGAHKEN